MKYLTKYDSIHGEDDEGQVGNLHRAKCLSRSSQASVNVDVDVHVS